jgi:hypothetical protein
MAHFFKSRVDTLKDSSISFSTVDPTDNSDWSGTHRSSAFNQQRGS